MADARSLLRQQRAARRIDHPHALYNEAGKLSCSVCREPVKSDALWDGHARSAGHRQRLLAQQKAKGTAPASAAPVERSKRSTDKPSDEALLAQIIGGAGQKRKHGEDADVDMADAAGEGPGEDDALRNKRSKQAMASPTGPSAASSSLNTPTTAAAAAAAATAAAVATSTGSPMRQDSPTAAAGGKDGKRTPPRSTPPGLTRRISNTPSQGVEIQIPSRPATPSVSAASTNSTPKGTSMGRSPFITQEALMGANAPTSTPNAGPKAKASFATAATSETSQNAPTTWTTAAAAATSKGDGGGDNDDDDDDDDDWAAFESEVVNAAPAANGGTAAAAAAAGYSDDAVISAAPVTAKELAAKSEEEERARRRAQAETELEDEKEDAKRALETEFEEMEELEARVRRLKEKREAIRRGSVPAPPPPPPPPGSGEVVAGTEAKPADVINGATAESKADGDDEDDDEEDSEEDDDWANFRFRG